MSLRIYDILKDYSDWFGFRQVFYLSQEIFKVPYGRHHKPLLITSRSWIQAKNKNKNFWKNLLKNKEMVFENGVKNIQAAAYNGACTVHDFLVW